MEKSSLKQIAEALKEVFLSYSPARSLIEAMMKYDFKIGEARVNLMQLCFSNLASWPLILILVLIFFDPTKASWSLVGYLSFENPLVLFLLDGRPLNMLALFLLFFALEWILKKEYILIAIIIYLVNRSEFHIHLATTSILAVYLSRLLYLWSFKADHESETRKIWKSVCILQLLAWGLVSLSALRALDYIQVNFLFNEATNLSRFNFLCIMILLYHMLSHLFLSFWGHFYFGQKLEPSKLPVYYSTKNWASHFKISKRFKSTLSIKTTEQLKKHLQSDVELQELKLQSPGLAKFSIAKVLAKEISYLKGPSFKKPVIVSACLAGFDCRYDCKNKLNIKIQEMVNKHEALPVCPEQLGGLLTPRPQAEKINTKIVTIGGDDVTTQYEAGAREALKLALEAGVDTAYLKTKSPMCGYAKIYDGSFKGHLIEGNGVFAELLIKHNIKIIPID